MWKYRSGISKFNLISGHSLIIALTIFQSTCSNISSLLFREFFTQLGAYKITYKQSPQGPMPKITQLIFVFLFVVSTKPTCLRKKEPNKGKIKRRYGRMNMYSFNWRSIYFSEKHFLLSIKRKNIFQKIDICYKKKVLHLQYFHNKS